MQLLLILYTCIIYVKKGINKMKDTKVELLKCINLTNVICSIPIFIYVLILKMEFQVALTTIIIYEIIYLLIKSFFTIGIKNNARNIKKDLQFLKICDITINKTRASIPAEAGMGALFL